MARRSRLEQQTWVIDTGVAIAAEANMAAFQRWRKASTLRGIVIALPPVVVMEARRSSQKDATMKVALNKLQPLTFDCADANRAADLLRVVARATPNNPGAAASAVGLNDPQIAVLAEKNGGVVITDNPGDFNALRDAGAEITVEGLPF
jgi:predicted nucleic acid-binding protein